MAQGETMDGFRFEEAWYILNLIGFNKLEYYKESTFAESPDGEGIVVKHHRWRKHQGSREAKFHVQMLFTDEHGYRFSNKRAPLRDTTIPIVGPEVCKRCGRIEKLERDHIIPLHLGGKDETANLQYLCYVCHKFKTTADKIDKELRSFREEEVIALTWRYRMWKYRKEAHERLNPVGTAEYHSYWDDPKTHWGHWGTIAKAEKVPRPEILMVKLDRFIEPSKPSSNKESLSL